MVGEFTRPTDTDFRSTDDETEPTGELNAFKSRTQRSRLLSRHLIYNFQNQAWIHIQRKLTNKPSKPLESFYNASHESRETRNAGPELKNEDELLLHGHYESTVRSSEHLSASHTAQQSLEPSTEFMETKPLLSSSEEPTDMAHSGLDMCDVQTPRSDQSEMLLFHEDALEVSKLRR